MKGLITDIQRASLHDGPGIRTTVFFKGCPLNCAWCHNPECISFEKQELFYPDKCIGCGKCSEECYSGARTVCGKEYTADELMAELIADMPYFINGGGVTFSGGEPMAQKNFLNDVIDSCKREKINCGIETSLIYYDAEVFKKIDFIIADFKIWDSDIHKKYTGISNEIIKENFIKLNEINIPIITRTPVIPGVEQKIYMVSEFLKKLKNVKQYELLPYHPLGRTKENALRKKQAEFEIPSYELMKEMNKYAFIR